MRRVIATSETVELSATTGSRVSGPQVHKSKRTRAATVAPTRNGTELFDVGGFTYHGQAAKPLSDNNLGVHIGIVLHEAILVEQI